MMNQTNLPALMLSLLTALAVLLSGCGMVGGACTNELRAGAQAYVFDEGGQEVLDAEVQASTDGGDMLLCEQMDDSNEYTCWQAGPGSVEIVASTTDGREIKKTVTVEETDDGCHRVTEQVDLTLPAAASQ